MSKIEGELNAEMMHPKVINEQRKALFAEMVRKTGSRQSVLDRLLHEIESLRNQLGNLLALIHRDGGHHQANVGTEQALIDAQKVLLDWRQSHDELAAMKEGE